MSITHSHHGRWAVVKQGTATRVSSKSRARRLARLYGGVVRRWRRAWKEHSEDACESRIYVADSVLSRKKWPRKRTFGAKCTWWCEGDIPF